MYENYFIKLDKKCPSESLFGHREYVDNAKKRNIWSVVTLYYGCNIFKLLKAFQKRKPS